MDYQKTYDALINFRKLNPPDGYSEKHHILPGSLGGSDEPSNLVALTAREHFVAHLLLHKIHRCRSTVYALFMMANCKSRYHDRKLPKKGSRRFKIIREDFIKANTGPNGRTLTDEHKEAIRQANTGRVFTVEHRQNIANSKVGKIRPSISDAHKAAISRGNTGRIRSEETRKQISKSKTGKKLPPRTPEHSAAISAAHQRRKLLKSM